MIYCEDMLFTCCCICPCVRCTIHQKVFSSLFWIESFTDKKPTLVFVCFRFMLYITLKCVWCYQIFDLACLYEHVEADLETGHQFMLNVHPSTRLIMSSSLFLLDECLKKKKNGYKIYFLIPLCHLYGSPFMPQRGRKSPL